MSYRGFEANKTFNPGALRAIRNTQHGVGDILKMAGILKQHIRSGAILHVLTAAFFVGVFLSLTSFLPNTTSAGELDSAIQLLTQVLAVIVGVLLIGTTVYLTSYDISDALNSIHGDLEQAFDPVSEKYFSGGRKCHKIDRQQFRMFLFGKLRNSDYLFYQTENKQSQGYFIYRPYWDGAWYQVFDSPFKSDDKSDEELFRIQAAHEAVICAYRVLAAVRHMRSSNAALLSTKSGTQGSISFLKDLEKQSPNNYEKLPDSLPPSKAEKIVGLALYSSHYMWEELREHSEELNWEPYRLSQFQLAFVDYSIWLANLIAKLQIMRMANANARFPGISARFSEKTNNNWSLETLIKSKQKAFEIRKRIVTVHGVARYFKELKGISIPGIGLAITALFLVLIGWPFIKLASTDTRLIGFAVMYSTGIAALVESSIFLSRMLWNKAPGKRRRLF
jgi:hypothetical protein